METTPSWSQEMRSALKSREELESFFDFSFPEYKSWPSFIPRLFAEKIKAAGPESALWKQFLPHQLEADQNHQTEGLLDPIGDQKHFSAPQLIHRYFNRVLFLPTSVCPIQCRYCFRKNELHSPTELFAPEFNQTLKYLREHPEIQEIIFTGGDPFILSQDRLNSFLKAFSEIESIKFVRFHTRTPVILPSRLDNDLLQLLISYQKKFRQIMVVVHVNHLDEIYPEVEEKLRLFQKAHVPILSQSVLLKGVNDSLESLLMLFQKLIELGIRPYYLHHPDKVYGGMHFCLSLEKGRALYSGLRDQLPGWALPQYVIDIPGGAGKVSAFNPESWAFSGRLIGKDGQFFELKA